MLVRDRPHIVAAMALQRSQREARAPGEAPAGPLTPTRGMASRSSRPSGSAAAHPVRHAAAGLFGDLLRDALVPRPLPPLDRLPLPSRVRQALPAVVREALRWAPHAGVLLLCLLLVRLQTQSEVIALDKLTGGILVAVALLMTLCWPVLSAWLLMLASAVSLFHLGGLAGPFPFADVKSWPDVLLDAQGRPWAVAGFLAFTAVMVIVALRLPLRAVVAFWVLTVALVAVGNGPFGVGALAMALFSGLMPLVGVVVAGQREAREEVAAHAAATQEERSRRMVLEERAVIARELHDVVAHHMSVVAIQAEAAPYRVERTPPELEKAFATVRESAVAALAELRRVLGVIRTESPESADGGAEAPQPTLADLDALLDGVRTLGAPPVKVVTGEVRSLPRGVELSAYRIVQEALSNALRHAPGTSVRVELAYVPDGLGLRIVNGPPKHPASPSPGAGHGLTGMRERAAMLDGQVRAAPADDGGFAVTGFLPSARTGAGDE
jgi:signal transduction histidine kinase